MKIGIIDHLNTASVETMLKYEYNFEIDKAYDSEVIFQQEVSKPSIQEIIASTGLGFSTKESKF